MPTISDARDTYATTLAFVGSRDELPLLLNKRRLFGCGVEVGVKEGEYSETLLHGWRGRHLISVDPWLEDDPSAYVDIANVPQSQHETFYRTACARLARFGDRSSVWRMTSIEAAERLPRHGLDFVYIDARHDYAAVMEDLAVWFDKVRPGGIIAGHDYVDGTFPAGEFGVRSAVDEFFSSRGIPVHATLLDEPWLTWIAEIPEPAESAEPLTAPASVVPRTEDYTIGLRAADANHRVTLRLDASQMSQRFMIAAFQSQQFYESETTQLLGAILRPGDTFIDVGAHVGYFSMVAAAFVGPGGRVFGFEPDTANFARLVEHVELNDAWQVEPVHMAVGERAHVARFFVNADNDGGHALWNVAEHPECPRTRLGGVSRPVYVTSLDRYFDGRSIASLRAVKIDAEGSEMAVLRGAKELLARHRVPFVVAEVNRFALERMGTSEREMRAHMTGLGYEVYAICPGETRLARLEADDHVDVPYVFNLLFRHPDAPTIG
jgi:FkbM family methyltransferase